MTDDKPRKIRHIVKTGGGGAGVVYEDAEVRFLEARVTIVGRVVQSGIPMFESVGD